MAHDTPPQFPEGIFSLLDTDLYKLTMQCAVLKYFPDVHVTYGFTNRTRDMKFSRAAYNWLVKQINKLGNIRIMPEEIHFLKSACPYLNESYLEWLQNFYLKPAEQINIKFTPVKDTGSEHDLGDLECTIEGLWVDTILYEIPLLALTSESYFKFCDTDWDYEGQEEKAYEKGRMLLEHGCLFSEFGSRRRRDYRTHDLVMKGLCHAAADGKKNEWKGTLSGTSNVHFAMKYGTNPIGTVAHEWYMTIAAYTNDYETANELGLRYWVGCFGEGVLGIALTDTFGSPNFFEAFKLSVPDYTTPAPRPNVMSPLSTFTTIESDTESPANTESPVAALVSTMHHGTEPKRKRTYAEVYTGIRQDSGDPSHFVQVARDFYDSQGIKEKKVVVFSDSLNVDTCLEYKEIAETAGFQPTFGVGTFFTNDFKHKSNGQKSVPLNIVIKISSANGHPAVKLSDNLGKNTGDKETVQQVKKRLGYIENEWEQGDETARWGEKGGLM